MTDEVHEVAEALAECGSDAFVLNTDPLVIDWKAVADIAVDVHNGVLVDAGSVVVSKQDISKILRFLWKRNLIMEGDWAVADRLRALIEPTA